MHGGAGAGGTSHTSSSHAQVHLSTTPPSDAATVVTRVRGPPAPAPLELPDDLRPISPHEMLWRATAVAARIRAKAQRKGVLHADQFMLQHIHTVIATYVVVFVSYYLGACMHVCTGTWWYSSVHPCCESYVRGYAAMHHSTVSHSHTHTYTYTHSATCTPPSTPIPHPSCAVPSTYLCEQSKLANEADARQLLGKLVHTGLL